MIKDRLTSPNFFIFFILLIISICIYLIAVQPGKNLPVTDSNPLSKNFYQTNDPWTGQTGKIATVKTNTGLCAIPNSDNCNVYTYYNNLNLNIVPNISNLFKDVNDGIAHITSSKQPNCLSTNQVYARQIEQTCNSNLTNQCIDSFGNYVTDGKKVENAINCSDNIPSCPGITAAITLNFEISFENTLQKNTKFLTVNFIEVSQKNFNNFKNINNIYYQQGLFILNTELNGKEDIFLPKFSNEPYDGNSFYQQFNIISYRYNSNTKEWQVDPSGAYLAIIYPPINAYLTVDIENKSSANFVFKSLESAKTVEETILWFFMPRLDLNPNKIPKTNKFDSGNIKNWSNQSTLFGTGGETIPNYKSFLPNYNKIPNNTLYISTEGLGNGNNQLKTPYDVNYSFWGPAAYPTNKQITQLNVKTNNLNLNRNYPDFIFKSTNSGYGSDSAEFYDLQITGGNLAVGYKNNTQIAPFFDETRFISLRQYNMDIFGSFADGPKPIGVFNYGSTFLDNEVTWQVLDPYELIVVFKNDYFLSSQGENIANNIIFNSAGSTDKIKYKEITKGEITSINFNNVNYNYINFTNSTYVIDLNDQNTSLKNTDYDSVATISLNFSKVELSSGKTGNAITSFSIISPGSSYPNNTVFSIKSVALDNQGMIDNLSLNSSNEELMFKAVPINSNGAPFNQTDLNPFIGSSFKNGGMVIPTKDITITPSGGLNLNNGVISLPESNGGEGYEINDTVYINQIDKNGNSVLGEQYNFDVLTKDVLTNNILASVKVETIQQATYDTFNSIAPYNLLRSHSNIGSSRAILLSDEYLQYNYWQDSPGVYDKSPQQIAYVGDGLIDQMKGSIIEGNEDEIISFFDLNDNKTNGVTSIDYIKTLQFAELNYIGFEDGNQNEIAIRNTNSLPNESPLILGRFIPYRKFTPPRTKNKGDRIPTESSDVTFYNNNFTQFLPINLGNAYNQIITTAVSTNSNESDLLPDFGSAT